LQPTHPTHGLYLTTTLLIQDMIPVIYRKLDFSFRGISLSIILLPQDSTPNHID